MKFIMIMIAILAFATSVFADGIILPEPWVDISIKYHRVEVQIRDQATTTFIDQVFINNANFDVEGIYMFPIPEGASISAFSMFVDGEPLNAEILPADEARRIYEDIVRQRIDPALLEYAGQGAYRARIFPIPANGEKRVQLSYDEIIERENDVLKYTYPLNTEKFSSESLEDVSVSVQINSTDPIKTIYSPSHDIAIIKSDDHNALAIYADEDTTPTQDFVLYYTISEDNVGINLLTFREEGLDGFYLLLASPKVEIAGDEIVNKRMIFILDTSGSMSRDNKMEQAKEALKFVLDNLDATDEFNIVAYNTIVSEFSDVSLQATPENVLNAKDFVDELFAGGGTNINGALISGLSFVGEDDLTNMMIFLTDGKPTIGVTENKQIISNAQNDNTQNVRLFVFGVGYDVNTILLDALSSQNSGISSYVTPEEDIEVEVSSFYSKVSNPVLSNLVLDFLSISVLDFYPQELPDLFKGSQIIQLGRFREDGTNAVILSGDVNGSPLVFQREVDFPLLSLENDFIPRLWATRKIGFLINQIRLHGQDQELVDEIISLSKEYGIITPYTSFLIVEDEVPPTFADDFTKESGAEAVAASDAAAGYSRASNAEGVQKEGVKYVGNKTFFLRDGFWQDSRYTKGEPALDFRYGSERYFNLISQKPELGRYLAIGTNVIVNFEGQTYRIGESITAVEEEGNDESSLPDQFQLDQNFPNPFNPRTTIRFAVRPEGQEADVELSVFNLSGQRIKTLVFVKMESGEYAVTWDGKDEVGKDVASGVYLYRLDVDKDSFTQTRKMVLMR